MARGRVKWFNDAKGYGFIEKLVHFSRNPSSAETENSNEIFVHYSAIVSDGHKTLAQGQEVEFDIYDGPKGRVAQNVLLKDC